jgi:hypothetical protein
MERGKKSKNQRHESRWERTNQKKKKSRTENTTTIINTITTIGEGVRARNLTKRKERPTSPVAKPAN